MFLNSNINQQIQDLELAIEKLELQNQALEIVGPQKTLVIGAIC